ncbi:conserved exported hypothetical protein [Bosea sp. 62]|uniref:hypothetical protein n=1 Tax=unclassified Bosea (in: a-proteobacteria) TaxID=2653178 RepID=UPI00125B99FB|nr:MULTISPECIES: hypothetical protein [unclassified Bosea (in: a-proteobacteria)]CAD5288160.1 conserved exported hypothetical protein [Bosea sp. 21B]CAD5290445.1 conserved exported hypothetical protein [Bosea sp. 46]CAD5300908.1 conserved exported hypothetical protein [Bosea sp. 7B]VVT60383.1 conserved exported hypothetical protein [Bosea sp. EC-HK365B]VXA98076.1 conserved exported hypothetical protein [Bosea sp. 62]
MKTLLSAAFLSLFSLASTTVQAEPVALTLKLVDEAGKPLAGRDVRVAIGSDAEISAPGTGQQLSTDAGGVIRMQGEATIDRRSVSSTSIYTRHPAEHLVIGVELDLIGRRALYRVRLDQTKAGTVGQINAFLAGAGGRFDQPLAFHADTQSWSLPDEPAGLRLTGIGAELVAQSMTGTAETGRTIILTIAKQSFKRR